MGGLQSLVYLSRLGEKNQQDTLLEEEALRRLSEDKEVESQIEKERINQEMPRDGSSIVPMPHNLQHTSRKIAEKLDLSSPSPMSRDYSSGSKQERRVLYQNSQGTASSPQSTMDSLKMRLDNHMEEAMNEVSVPPKSIKVTTPVKDLRQSVGEQAYIFPSPTPQTQGQRLAPDNFSVTKPILGEGEYNCATVLLS